MSKYQIIFTIL